MAQIPGVTFESLLQQLSDLHRSEVCNLRNEIRDLKALLGPELPQKPNSNQDIVLHQQEPDKVWQSPPPNLRTTQMTTTDSADRRSSAEDKTQLEIIVESSLFEGIFGVLILLNAFLMALEVQYKGIDVEVDLGYRGASRGAAQEWPGADVAFEVLDWFFGVAFTAELVAKMLGLRLKFFWDVWNVIDGLIVLSWVGGKAFAGVLPLTPSVLRMIRLARLLRTLRLVRKISTFDALYLMMASIKGSMTILFWTIMFLVLTEMFMALVMSQLLHEYYFYNGEICASKNSSTWNQNRCVTLQAEKELMFQYFGTFTRALFSMFELTLANWPPISRALSEYVSQWFMLLTLLHKLTLGFAILGVINGVFMQETFKVAALDDELITRQKKRVKQAHKAKMTYFFESADRSNDNFISLREFRKIMKDEDFKIWLSAMEFDVQPEEVDRIYHILDKDNSNSLTVDELVAGVARLKGGAKSIHAITTILELEEIKKMVLGLAQQCNSGSRLLAAGVPALGAKPVGVLAGEARSPADVELIPTSPEGARGSAFEDEARNEAGDLTGKPAFKAKKQKSSKKLMRTKPEIENAVPKDADNSEATQSENHATVPGITSQSETAASGRGSLRSPVLS